VCILESHAISTKSPVLRYLERTDVDFTLRNMPISSMLAKSVIRYLFLKLQLQRLVYLLQRPQVSRGFRVTVGRLAPGIARQFLSRSQISCSSRANSDPLTISALEIYMVGTVT